MVTTKPAFKDYEYGWYGLAGSCKSKYFDLAYNHQRHNQPNVNPKAVFSDYQSSYNVIKKQLPKLKGVIFIYGDYKDI